MRARTRKSAAKTASIVGQSLLNRQLKPADSSALQPEHTEYHVQLKYFCTYHHAIDAQRAIYLCISRARHIEFVALKPPTFVAAMFWLVS